MYIYFLLMIFIMLLLENMNMKDLFMIFIIWQVSFFLILSSSLWFHIMILLMILEMITLCTFIFSATLLNWFFMGWYFIFMFITLSVAEASLGLSTLTLLVRFHGSDFLKI